MNRGARSDSGRSAPASEERPARGRRGRFSWAGVVLTGLFVIASAGVTAYATTKGPLILQHQQDRREDRLTAVQARGAARILFAEFEQATFQMAVLRSDRLLRRFDPTYRLNIAQADVRLIASKLTGEQW